jgi:hypothetical protein
MIYGAFLNVLQGENGYHKNGRFQVFWVYESITKAAWVTINDFYPHLVEPCLNVSILKPS